MSEDGGWTRSYRRKWRNPVFLNFRDAAVWSYLIDNAAWADGTDVRFEGIRVTLQAGQIAVSERFLAKGFGCDRQVIRRIFEALEKDHMATREKTHGITILTICKYKEYQGYDEFEKPAEPREKTQVEPTGNPNINTLNEGKKDDDGDPPEREHIVVTRKLFQILGVDPEDMRWFGSRARVEMWIKQGWSAEDLIFPAARKLMASRGAQGPPNNIAYVEKVIETFAKDLSRPLPDVQNVSGTRTAKPAKPSLDEQLATLDRLGSDQPGAVEPWPDTPGGIVIDQPVRRH